MERPTRGAVCAVAVLLSMTAFADGPTDDPAALAKELETVLARLREVRSAAYARERARADEIERAKLPVKHLEKELTALTARKADTERELAEVRAEVAGLHAEEKSCAAAEASLKAALDPAVANAAARVEKGVPYRREDRSARLAAAKDPARTTSDRLASYWTHLLEELRIARSGEAYNAEVEVDPNRVKPARLFRVGHLVLGFLTEDGLESGLWRGGRWATCKKEEQERVRAAIDMLDRRRGPELLPLPVEAEVRR